MRRGFDPLACSVCGDPGQIAAETNRQLTAATNPIEHLQLGAVEVRDHRHGRCDPGQRVVLRREVMKVRDRRPCGPTLDKEPLPGADLSLGVSIVERREQSIRRPDAILERRMQRDLTCHRVVAPVKRRQRRREVGRPDIEAAKERLSVCRRPRPAKRPRKQPHRPALTLEGCGQITGDLRRTATRIEQQPHRHRLSHRGVLADSRTQAWAGTNS